MSFKNYASKTVPLSSTTVFKTNKGYKLFNIKEDLKPGDQIYYRGSTGRRIIGSFVRYETSSFSTNDLEIWANWEDEESSRRSLGWMPPDRVYLAASDGSY